MTQSPTPAVLKAKQSLEVFLQFLMLGCISFGGPAAHMGYFHNHFVTKKQWISEQEFANLMALSQFIPGPGSSQLGFAIGLHRAGTLGGIAAFIGFTLPSFLLMFLLVFSQLENSNNPYAVAIIDSMKLLAVVVVADAVWTMANSFCRKFITQILAIATTIILIFFPSLMTQMLVLVAAALCGLFLHKHLVENNAGKTTQKILQPKYFWLAVFTTLLVLPLFGLNNIFTQFYQAGALVFGGGHVVLPLLQETVGEQVTTEQFLLGYSAAQAVPGPMFTFATYLGGELGGELFSVTDNTVSNVTLGATIATLGIFLPGFLLIYALKDSWSSLTQLPKLKAMVSALNAAVVGLLAAALVNPIISSGIKNYADLAIAIIGFGLLRYFKVSIIYYVIGFILLGLARGFLQF